MDFLISSISKKSLPLRAAIFSKIFSLKTAIEGNLERGLESVFQKNFFVKLKFCLSISKLK